MNEKKGGGFFNYVVLTLVLVGLVAAAPLQASRRGRCIARCIERFVNIIDDRCDTWWCTILPGCSQGCYQAATHDLEICLGACTADYPD